MRIPQKPSVGDSDHRVFSKRISVFRVELRLWLCDSFLPAITYSTYSRRTNLSGETRTYPPKGTNVIPKARRVARRVVRALNLIKKRGLRSFVAVFRLRRFSLTSFFHTVSSIRVPPSSGSHHWFSSSRLLPAPAFDMNLREMVLDRGGAKYKALRMVHEILSSSHAARFF